MLRAIFVYKGKSGSNYTWEKYEDFDCVMNLPYWKRPCDLETPEIPKRRRVDACPLCTVNEEHDPISEVKYWGLCGDCGHTEFITRDGDSPRVTVSEISGRPVLFYFTGSEPREKLLEQTQSRVNEITEFWSFLRP